MREITHLEMKRANRSGELSWKENESLWILNRLFWIREKERSLRNVIRNRKEGALQHFFCTVQRVQPKCMTVSHRLFLSLLSSLLRFN